MKALVVLLVVVALAYGAYSGILAAGTYFQVAQIVDDAVLDLRPVTSAAAGSDGPQAAARLRDAILTRAATSRLPIRANDVAVTEAPQGLVVQITWTQPVIVYRNDVVVALPLSVTRTIGADRLGR
jgi:hypothetical protein